jgi:hypothetical protein
MELAQANPLAIILITSNQNLRMSIYKTFVRLSILSSTLTHKDITSIIGLKPNKHWKVGMEG